jgi:hypothetical protein
MAEFTSAVEQKQVAQQDAERARYLVEKVCENYCCFEFISKLFLF